MKEQGGGGWHKALPGQSLRTRTGLGFGAEGQPHLQLSTLNPTWPGCCTGLASLIADAPTAKTWCPAGSPGQDLAGSRWGPRAGRRRERRKKAAIAKTSTLKGEMASSPLSCCPSQPPAAAPRTKKILVDLRPILDSIVESPEPRTASSHGAQGADGHGGSDGQTPSPAPRVDQAGRGAPLPPVAPRPRERQQEAVTSGQPESQAWGLGGTSLVPGWEPGPPISLPLLVTAAKASAPEQSSAADTVGAPLGSQHGRSRGTWCDTAPAPLQEGREDPHPHAPTVPAWDEPARGPAGGCVEGVAVSPPQADVLDTLWPPRSPDVQLPTRLLLWRLQETTSSGHHRLIAQTLRTLRMELQDEATGLGSE